MTSSNHFNRAGLQLLFRLIPQTIQERMAVHLGRPDLRFSLLQLRRFGFCPKRLLDCGAYRGDWTRTCLELWPEASAVCIEPQKAPQTALTALAGEKAPRVKVMQGVLGATDQATVCFSETGTGSSLLASKNGDTTCPMWRVDSLIDGGMEPFDFVKLDVQGYELQVLSGFEQHLKQCTLLQVELSLLPIVDGAPLIADVVAYLDQRQFVLCDIDELIRSPSDGAVWQIDALFCRRDSPLRIQRRWR